VRFLTLLLAIQCQPATAQGVIPHQYALMVLNYCAETGIPVYIAVGMATEESKWNPMAKGYSKPDKHGKRHLVAGGLFQLNFSCHDEFREKYNGGKEFSEYDPEANTRIALRYLASLVKRFGKFRPALNYFNAGYPAGVIRSVRETVSRELEGVWSVS